MSWYLTAHPGLPAPAPSVEAEEPYMESDLQGALWWPLGIARQDVPRGFCPQLHSLHTILDLSTDFLAGGQQLPTG